MLLQETGSFDENSLYSVAPIKIYFEWLQDFSQFMKYFEGKASTMYLLFEYSGLQFTFLKIHGFPGARTNGAIDLELHSSAT